MEDFKNEKERNTVLRKLFSDVYIKYPHTVSQKQAAEICQVDVQTIRKWEKDGELPFTLAIDGLLHYQIIKVDDLLTCLYRKECLHDTDSLYMKKLRQFYAQKYKDYPEALLIRNVVAMTGYVKTTVVNWMNSGYLKGYNKGKIYRIPKKYLIDFVCGSYYRQIKRKSNIQKTDMQNFLEELKILGLDL
jgi:transposase